MTVEELNRWLTIGVWTAMGLTVFILLIPTIFRKQIENHFRREITKTKKKSKSPQRKTPK